VQHATNVNMYDIYFRPMEYTEFLYLNYLFVKMSFCKYNEGYAKDLKEDCTTKQT
jgi:hypothetical protein